MSSKDVLKCASPSNRPRALMGLPLYWLVLLSPPLEERRGVLRTTPDAFLSSLCTGVHKRMHQANMHMPDTSRNTQINKRLKNFINWKSEASLDYLRLRLVKATVRPCFRGKKLSSFVYSIILFLIPVCTILNVQEISVIIKTAKQGGRHFYFINNKF